MKKKEAVKIFKDFVTGKISTPDFWEKYTSDESLRSVLVNDRKRKKGIIKTRTSEGVPIILRFNDKNFSVNPDNLTEVIDINKLYDRFELFGVVERYFLMRGVYIPESEYNNDAKEYYFLESMLPEYVDAEFEFLEKLYAEAPEDYSKFEKLDWCKSKINEMFEYDKNPPEWNQWPEWPRINGKPLVFSYQEETDRYSELYHFYDRDTKETVVIEQYE